MLLAIDVQYEDDSAVAAGVLFSSWMDEACDGKSSPPENRTVTKTVTGIAPYEPGNFYKRELPCILKLLDEVNLDEVTAIVIDGYVSLGKAQKPGLGMHLYEAINKAIPVIGVAKNRFADTPADCEIFRGSSQSPLFVTSVKMPLAVAKANIEGMHGENRIPTLLKKVDQLCRCITA